MAIDRGLPLVKSVPGFDPPLRTGPIAGFWNEGRGSIVAYSDLSSRSAWKGAIGAGLEKFEDCSKISQNHCTKNTLKLYFKAILDGHFFDSVVQKISNFLPDVQNQHFSFQALIFVLRSSRIGPISHKNAIKHENIDCRVVFRCRKCLNCFWPLKHCIFWHFFVLMWGSIAGFLTDVRQVHTCPLPTPLYYISINRFIVNFQILKSESIFWQVNSYNDLRCFGPSTPLPRFMYILTPCPPHFRNLEARPNLNFSMPPPSPSSLQNLPWMYY